MSWKTEHFRDPIHKQRALEARNNGGGKAHASWDAAHKARKQANREEEKALVADSFELWFLKTRQRIRNIQAQADHDCLRIRMGYGPTDEIIPF
jgi:hypothetical protein